MANDLTNSNSMAAVLFDDEQAKKAFTLANLIFNPQAMEALHTTAVTLANSGLVPDHLRKKPDDVMAVLMQAGRWGMDPVAVAQASFVLNGKIGYEAKLQQAVARANGGIEFDDEYYGDWSKIQGNFRIEKNQNQKKYNAPNWKPQDEIGIGIKLTGKFPDGRVKVIDVPLVTCHPRNSTNWANDPQQQIYYTSIKRWVRRYAPHLNLGIQDYDDLAAREQYATEREINPMSAEDKTASGSVQTVDDILNAETTSDTAEKPASQKIEFEVTGVESVDDILGNNEPEPVSHENAPSVYEQMVDMLSGVNTADDYAQAKAACLEAFHNGLINETDSADLGKLMRTLESSLGIKKK